MPRPPISVPLSSRSGGGVSLNSFYSALYDTWTNKPSDVVSEAMNTFFEKLNGDNAESFDYLGNWDAAWLFGNHINTDGEALKNIVNPTGTAATMVNSPYYNNFTGFRGDAISKYVNTNWNPTDDSPQKMTVANSSFGYYGLDDTTSTSNAHGTIETNACYIELNLGDFYYRINNQTTIQNRTYNDKRKLIVGQTIDDTQTSSYLNGIYNLNNQNNNPGFAQLDIRLLARNGGGVSDERIGFAFVGASMTEAQCIELENILDWWFNFEWLSLGDELITDPNCETESEWVHYGNWNFQNPYWYYDNVGTNKIINLGLNTSGDNRLTVGKWYMLEFELDSSGWLQIYDGSSYYNFKSYVGTSRYIFKATGYRFDINGRVGLGAFNMKYLSVKEIVGL